jgi:hypothetical protein
VVFRAIKIKNFENATLCYQGMNFSARQSNSKWHRTTACLEWETFGYNNTTFNKWSATSLISQDTAPAGNLLQHQ